MEVVSSGCSLQDKDKSAVAASKTYTSLKISIELVEIPPVLPQCDEIA